MISFTETLEDYTKSSLEEIQARYPKAKIYNGQVVGTFMGVEDHGLFKFYIDIKFSGGNQAFGTLILDKPIYEDDIFARRVGTAHGLTFIMDVMEALDIRRYEDFFGTKVRILQEHYRIHGIGNWIDEKWVFTDDYKTKH